VDILLLLAINAENVAHDQDIEGKPHQGTAHSSD
jgi:hypothetical protein